MFLSRTVCEKAARTVRASRMNAFRLPIAEAPAVLAIDQSKKRQNNFWKKFMKCFSKKPGRQWNRCKRKLEVITETVNLTTVWVSRALAPNGRQKLFYVNFYHCICENF